MNVWLDDERPEPKDWKRVYWPSEAIELLRTGTVSEISLDHDLGADEIGTGYDVLLWIEEQVYTNPGFVLPIVHIHTANPAARSRMERALFQIQSRYSLG